MIMVIKFILNFCDFSIIVCFFLTKFLILGILFSIAVNAVFVAKLLILAILFSTVFNSVFVAKFFSDFSIVVSLFNKTTSIRNFIF